MEIKLLANSSSQDDPYCVTFTKENESLIIYCDCPAGIKIHGRSICKHKIELAMGNNSMLYDISQSDDLETVNKWVFQTDLFDGLFKIKKLQKQIDEKQIELKKQKKMVGKLMKNGVTFIE